MASARIISSMRERKLHVQSLADCGVAFAGLLADQVNGIVREVQQSTDIGMHDAIAIAKELKTAEWSAADSLTIATAVSAAQTTASLAPRVGTRPQQDIRMIEHVFTGADWRMLEDWTKSIEARVECVALRCYNLNIVCPNADTLKRLGSMLVAASKHPDSIPAEDRTDYCWKVKRAIKRHDDHKRQTSEHLRLVTDITQFSHQHLTTAYAPDDQPVHMPGRIHMEFAKVLPSIGYRSNHGSLQSSGLVPARPGQLDFMSHPFGQRAPTKRSASYQNQQHMQMMMLQAGANLVRFQDGRGGGYGTIPGSPDIDIKYHQHGRPHRSPSPSEHSDGGSAIVPSSVGGRTTSHEQLPPPAKSPPSRGEALMPPEVASDKLSPSLAIDPVQGLVNKMAATTKAATAWKRLERADAVAKRPAAQDGVADPSVDDADLGGAEPLDTLKRPAAAKPAHVPRIPKTAVKTAITPPTAVDAVAAAPPTKKPRAKASAATPPPSAGAAPSPNAEASVGAAHEPPPKRVCTKTPPKKAGEAPSVAKAPPAAKAAGVEPLEQKPSPPKADDCIGKTAEEVMAVVANFCHTTYWYRKLETRHRLKSKAFKMAVILGRHLSADDNERARKGASNAAGEWHDALEWGDID